MNQMMMYSGQPPAAVMLPPELQEGYAHLSQLSIFHGIPPDMLGALVAQRLIETRSLARDIFVADPLSVSAGVAPVFFVMQGQIAAAAFDSEALAERRSMQEQYNQMSEDEREELSRLRPPPLARVAKKNIAAFMKGDLFNSGALIGGSGDPVAFYTAGATEVAIIQHAAIAELAARFPFFEARFRRAIQISRARLRNITGVKQELLDFFIRQGISVSGSRVRVRQLEFCIDCKQCEQACEERYGARRLTLGGFQLGMLDFVYTCRTCVDQRCVDPCNYDSIKYNAERGEVVINETSCTGCTLCAQSCPYGAIEMVDVEDPANPTYREDFKIRLDAAGALRFGAGAPRVARPRRIANKCDHCMNYGDQACVSACPTGALIEVSAYDLFRERPEFARAVAESGYDQDFKPKSEEILPTQPFTKGIGIRDGGKARIRRGRYVPLLTWGIGLMVFLACTVEIMLRAWWPESSLEYFLFMQEPDMVPAIARERVNFRAGDPLAIYCGYLGTLLMAIAALYPMMRRIRLFRFLASNTMWFDFHMMAGTVGPLFIVLHAAFKLDNWVSTAFWSMIIVAVSGAIGRYLYTQVPDLLNGRVLEELDHERTLASYRSSYPQTVAQADAMLARHRQKAEHIAQNAGMVRTLFWLIMEDVRRPFRWFRRRRILKRTGAPRAAWKEVSRRVGRMMLADRRRVIVPRAQLLLHSWKKVHVPFTIIMVIISAVHIWVAFKYSMSGLWPSFV
jgi:Fe-S-cluster-containing hydrogenase component 2